MATSKAVYVDSQQVYPVSGWTGGPGGYATDLCMGLPWDWGSAPVTVHGLSRPVFDGEIYLGSHTEPRDFTLPLTAIIQNWNGLSEANREAVKDDMHGRFLKWLKPGGGTAVIRLERGSFITGSLTTIKRVLTVRPTAFPGWAIPDRGVGHDHTSQVVEAPIPLRASFPWWADYGASGFFLEGSASGSHTSPVAIPLTNNGDMNCGFQVGVKGTAGITSITISISNDVAASIGSLTASVNLSATTEVVFDFWCSDPLSPPQFKTGVATASPFTLVGLADLARTSITSWPNRVLYAQASSLPISASVTVAGGTGTFTAYFRIRRWWADP